MFHPIVYADDSILTGILSAFNIIRNITSNNNSEQIHSELNKISIWLKLNKLSLNTSKTKWMVFHMPQKQVTLIQLEIGKIEFEKVKEFNFLGIVINEQLNWKSHVAFMSCKISRTNGIINRLKHYLPLHIKLSV